MKRMGHVVLLFSGIVGLGSSVLGCGTKEKQEPTPSPEPMAQLVRFDPAALTRLGVRVDHAGKLSATYRLEFPGSLDYNLDRYAEVGAIVEGRISNIGVKVGDRVKKGQTLGTLTVPAIVQAQAEYLSARAREKVARDHVARETTLMEQKLTTAREAELARGDALTAEATLSAAAAKLQMYGASLPESDKAMQARGTLALVSPLDGVVVRRDAVAGAFLEPSESAFTIADPASLWATFEVFEMDMPYVRAGAEAELRFDALDTSITGKIEVLEPHVGKSTRAARARIAVDNSQGVLRPGLFARVFVPIEAPMARGGMLVPSAAVQPLGDKQVVFVEREPGLFEVRAVQVDARSSQLASVRGIDAADRIATHGAFIVRGEAAKQ